MKIENKLKEFVLDIYKIKYPNEEKFGIQSQIRRSSLSILLNIVEGNGRQTKKDYLNFCYMAKGSLFETMTLLNISYELNYLENPFYNLLVSDLIEVNKMLYGLINYLKSKI